MSNKNKKSVFYKLRFIQWRVFSGLEKIFFGLIIFFSFFSYIGAETLYTSEDVLIHNKLNDCWMTLENKVYDVSDYIKTHNTNYMNITSWCGRDMTSDFKTKAGRGVDHRGQTYAMLQSYYVGDLNNLSQANNTESNQSDIETQQQTQKNPYNLFLPIFLILLVYIPWKIICASAWAKKYKILSVAFFNLFWNTVLLLSLIPSLIFGIFLILRYSFPSLHAIKINFLYYHVEGGIIMGTVGLLHFIQRRFGYIAPFRIFKQNKKEQ